VIIEKKRKKKESWGSRSLGIWRETKKKKGASAKKEERVGKYSLCAGNRGFDGPNWGMGGVDAEWAVT